MFPQYKVKLITVISNEQGVKVQASEAIPYKFSVLNYQEIASSHGELNEIGTRNDGYITIKSFSCNSL